MNQLRPFNEPPECLTRRSKYRFFLCVWHYGSSQAGHPGSVLFMSAALLRQFNFTSLFTSLEWTLSNTIAMKADKSVKPLCVCRCRPIHITCRHINSWIDPFKCSFELTLSWLWAAPTPQQKSQSHWPQCRVSLTPGSYSADLSSSSPPPPPTILLCSPPLTSPIPS